MTKDLDRIGTEARAYAVECNAANRLVSMGDFCERLGMNRQWLSTGHSIASGKARAVVLKEWAALGVKANPSLRVALNEAAGKSNDDREWEIPESDWPSYQDLPRILGRSNRRAMFEGLRNRHGQEVAMRYAYVCDRATAKGGSQDKASVDEAV